MRLISITPVLRRWLFGSLVAVSMLSLIVLNLPLAPVGGAASWSADLISSGPK